MDNNSTTHFELLLPRVLCIGSGDMKIDSPIFPGSTLVSNLFRVGKIITLSVFGEFGNCFIDESESEWYEKDFKEYPNCFRILKWYELRNEDEMPKYLRELFTNKVKRVFKYEMTKPIRVTEWKCKWSVGHVFFYSSKNIGNELFCYGPATKEEYKKLK